MTNLQAPQAQSEGPTLEHRIAEFLRAYVPESVRLMGSAELCGIVTDAMREGRVITAEAYLEAMGAEPACGRQILESR